MVEEYSEGQIKGKLKKRVESNETDNKESSKWQKIKY